jgi:hypothetical protein
MDATQDNLDLELDAVHTAGLTEREAKHIVEGLFSSLKIQASTPTSSLSKWKTFFQHLDVLQHMSVPLEFQPLVPDFIKWSGRMFGAIRAWSCSNESMQVRGRAASFGHEINHLARALSRLSWNKEASMQHAIDFVAFLHEALDKRSHFLLKIEEANRFPNPEERRKRRKKAPAAAAAVVKAKPTTPAQPSPAPVEVVYSPEKKSESVPTPLPITTCSLPLPDLIPTLLPDSDLPLLSSSLVPWQEPYSPPPPPSTSLLSLCNETTSSSSSSYYTSASSSSDSESDNAPTGSGMPLQNLMIQTLSKREHMESELSVILDDSIQRDGIYNMFGMIRIVQDGRNLFTYAEIARVAGWAGPHIAREKMRRIKAMDRTMELDVPLKPWISSCVPLHETSALPVRSALALLKKTVRVQ